MAALGAKPEAVGFLLEGHPVAEYNGVYKLQTEHKGLDGLYQHDLDLEGWALRKKLWLRIVEHAVRGALDAGGPPESVGRLRRRTESGGARA